MTQTSGKAVRIVFRKRYARDRGDFDSDQPVVDAMLQPYRGVAFDDVPPDPRTIDVATIAALRERLSSQYSYRWRGLDANMELAEALFAGRRSRNGGIIYLTHGFHLKDAAGHGPPFTRSPIRWDETDGYRRQYYVTVAISRVSGYIHDLGSAEALVRQVLPKAGYAMTWGAGGHRLRLEHDGGPGPWFETFPAALALVIALLERLERHPDEAAAWRRPP